MDAARPALRELGELKPHEEAAKTLALRFR